jgi:hypothetical protein
MHFRTPIALAFLSYVGAQGCSEAEDLQVAGADVAQPTGALGPEAPPPEFDPLSLRVGVAKAKDLLTGLPITDAELSAAGSLDAFKSLVDSWSATPQFDDTMLRFFADAFEQSPIGKQEMLGFSLALARTGDFVYYEERKMIRALHEMFARTVLGIVQEGRPFTEVATTTRFKLNTPLMATLLFLDAHPRGDDQQFAEDSWLLRRFPAFKMATTNNNASGQPVPIPFEDTIREGSPNFMRWFRNDCPRDRPEELATGPFAVELAFTALFGMRQQGCTDPSLFADPEWQSWKWVTVRKAGPSENPSLFWDVPGLRAASEIVVRTPRVGFFSTPAFFARWPTNGTNSFRVTANQALIVGLGHSLNSDVVLPTVSDDVSDNAHLRPGSTCVGCHQTLDPLRDFFRHDYSTGSTPRPPGSLVVGGAIGSEAVFKFGSSVVRGRGVESLAAAIADHQDFAKAWTQKLCMWANAAPCVDDDPEFQRVVTAFRGSNHNFKVLLRELLTSPLVTFASRTKSSDRNGAITSVARRDIFCQRLSARIGLSDVCQQSFVKDEYGTIPNEQAYSYGLPQINYVRGEALAVVPSLPGILFQPAIERICRQFANTLVGQNATAGAPWGLTNFSDAAIIAAELRTAIDQFVTVLMGVPKADESYSELRLALQQHYDDTFAIVVDIPNNRPESQALRSTFVAACSSPFVTTMGL